MWAHMQALDRGGVSEHCIHTRTCAHPHAHTHRRTHCGLRYDAEPTASGVPTQRSPRICLPAGVNLQPWSSDIQPRIATSMSKETDALCATSCAYTLPLGSAPLPPSQPPLALFFLFGSFTPALQRRCPASTSPRKGPYLSDRQNVTPAANLVTLVHDGPLSRHEPATSRLWVVWVTPSAPNSPEPGRMELRGPRIPASSNLFAVSPERGPSSHPCFTSLTAYLFCLRPCLLLPCSCHAMQSSGSLLTPGWSKALLVLRPPRLVPSRRNSRDLRARSLGVREGESALPSRLDPVRCGVVGRRPADWLPVRVMLMSLLPTCHFLNMSRMW